MERDITSPNRPSIKTASDWTGLFSIPRNLDSTSYSRYTSSLGSTTPPLSRRSYTTATSSYDYPRSSAYSTAYSSSRPFVQSRRPFTSRFLKRSQASSDEEDNGRQAPINQPKSTRKDEDDEDDSKAEDGETAEKGRKTRYRQQGAVLNNGTIIRLRREVSTSEEESTESEATNSSSEELPTAEETSETAIEPVEPEDPLDREERELNNQLMLSLTLTLVDEENIRQRLLEIKKSRLRRNQQSLEQSLVQKFVNDAEVTLFENQPSAAKQEEERILMQKLTTSLSEDEEKKLSDVEQRDIQVRLQELFRDKKNILQESLQNIETTYEHILQETSTELTELETSINNKNELVQRLQDEILSMTVRKELLSKAMEQINDSHQQKAMGLKTSIDELDKKMSEFAVVLPKNTNSSPDKKTLSKLSDIEPSDELREIESELECPVCMEIARPPIYQCEEGHIICCNCKPLLTNCPHNCGKKYSEPAIRCRFAEKLADKYAAQLAKHFNKK